MVSGTSNQQKKIEELSTEIEHLHAALRQRENELDDKKNLLSKREEESEFLPARTEHMARRHSTAIKATLLFIVSATLVGIFYLIDRKVPNAARAAYVVEALPGSPQAAEEQAAKASLSTVIVRTEPNSERSGTLESGRALVYSAIEAYTCQSASKKDPLSASKRDPLRWAA